MKANNYSLILADRDVSRVPRVPRVPTAEPDTAISFSDLVYLIQIRNCQRRLDAGIVNAGQPAFV